MTTTWRIGGPFPRVAGALVSFAFLPLLAIAENPFLWIWLAVFLLVNWRAVAIRVVLKTDGEHASVKIVNPARTYRLAPSHITARVSSTRWIKTMVVDNGGHRIVVPSILFVGSPENPELRGQFESWTALRSELAAMGVRVGEASNEHASSSD